MNLYLVDIRRKFADYFTAVSEGKRFPSCGFSFKAWVSRLHHVNFGVPPLKANVGWPSDAFVAKAYSEQREFGCARSSSFPPKIR